MHFTTWYQSSTSAQLIPTPYGRTDATKRGKRSKPSQDTKRLGGPSIPQKLWQEKQRNRHMTAPWFPRGNLCQDPPRIPKSADAHAPYIKGCSIRIEPMNIFPYTLNQP